MNNVLFARVDVLNIIQLHSNVNKADANLITFIDKTLHPTNLTLLPS